MRTPNQREPIGPLDAVLMAVDDRLPESQSARSTVAGKTLRDETNAMIAYAVRNGFLEELHASLAGISDEEMRKLMIEATARLAGVLHLRDAEPYHFETFVNDYGARYCKRWERENTTYDIPDEKRVFCGVCDEEIRSYWNACPYCRTHREGGTLPEWAR